METGPFDVDLSGRFGHVSVKPWGVSPTPATGSIWLVSNEKEESLQ